MHTACVVGKNYRLQDIQLSKMPLGLAECLTLRVLSAYSPHSRLQAQAVSGELANLWSDQPCWLRRAAPAGVGGEYRARTGDLLVANQALSQLS
jgi:hypothetical protein